MLESLLQSEESNDGRIDGRVAAATGLRASVRTTARQSPTRFALLLPYRGRVSPSTRLVACRRRGYRSSDNSSGSGAEVVAVVRFGIREIARAARCSGREMMLPRMQVEMRLCVVRFVARSCNAASPRVLCCGRQVGGGSLVCHARWPGGRREAGGGEQRSAASRQEGPMTKAPTPQGNDLRKSSSNRRKTFVTMRKRDEYEKWNKRK